jgi:hypothetical protein
MESIGLLGSETPAIGDDSAGMNSLPIQTLTAVSAVVALSDKGLFAVRAF